MTTLVAPEADRPKSGAEGADSTEGAKRPSRRSESSEQIPTRERSDRVAGSERSERPYSREYTFSNRVNCGLSRTTRLVRPHGLRPFWYLKSIQCPCGRECRNVSHNIGR